MDIFLSGQTHPELVKRLASGMDVPVLGRIVVVGAQTENPEYELVVDMLDPKLKDVTVSPDFVNTPLSWIKENYEPTITVEPNPHSRYLDRATLDYQKMATEIVDIASHAAIMRFMEDTEPGETSSSTSAKATYIWKPLAHHVFRSHATSIETSLGSRPTTPTCDCPLEGIGPSRRHPIGVPIEGLAEVQPDIRWREIYRPTANTSRRRLGNYIRAIRADLAKVS